MTWLEAFKTALNNRWPDTAPRGVVELRRVLDSVPFTAPEVLGGPVRRAWTIYEQEGDTPVGRAAVALTYCIQALKDDRVRP